MERIITGYCRSQDQARTLMVEYEDGQWDIPCDFPDCPFVSSCQIAGELHALLKETAKEDPA